MRQRLFRVVHTNCTERKGLKEVDPCLDSVSLGVLDGQPDDNAFDEPSQNGLPSNGGGFTIDEALNAAGLGKFQWFLLAYVGLAWFGDAMEMMLLSFLSPEVACRWNLSETQESWLTSVVFIGMMIGAYTSGSISDKMGRKTGIFATAAVTAVMGMASAFVPNYESLLLFRGLVGVGLGGVPVAFTMLAEVTPARHRGTFLILLEIFWSFGAVFQAGIAWAILPNGGWRTLLFVSAIPLVLLLCFYPLLPESPRFLAANGQIEKAVKVLERIAKTNGKKLLDGALVTKADKKKAGLESSLKDGIERTSNKIFRLFSPSLRPTTTIVWSMWFAASLGYYGIILLTTELHSSTAGTCLNNAFTFTASDYSSIFIDTLGEVPVFAVALLVDVVGRKRLLVGCFLATFCSLGPLLFTSQWSTWSLFVSRLFVESAFDVTYVYTPEAYPTYIRTYALGVANVFSRLGGILAPFVAQDLLRKTGADPPRVTVSVFMVMALVGALSATLIPRETKRKELLEEEEGVFEKAKEPQRMTDRRILGATADAEDESRVS